MHWKIFNHTAIPALYTALILVLATGFLKTTDSWAAQKPSHKGESISMAAGICVRKAQALFQEGRIQAAIDTVENFLDPSESRKKKDIHYLCFVLGNFYASLPQADSSDHRIAFKKAVHYYKKSLEINPTLTAAWLNLAKCCYDTQAYQEAAIAFEKGYEHSKEKKATHLYYAAVCHFQAQNSRRALALFDMILTLHPDEITLAWKEILINILFSLDQYETALPHIEQLAKETKPPKQKQWQKILLDQYLSLEMDDKALDFARYLTRTYPLEPKWWKGLSHVYLKNNTLAKGLSALVIYGYLTPLAPEEQKLAADLYMALEIPSQAAMFYQKVLQQAHDPHTRKKLAQAFIMAFDQESALKCIDKGLLVETADTPAHPDLLALKARILYTRQAYEKAAAAYEQVTQCKAESRTTAEAWLMLGYASMNCSRLERARIAFEMAARHKTHKEQAQKAMTRLKAMKAYASSLPTSHRSLKKTPPEREI